MKNTPAEEASTAPAEATGGAPSRRAAARRAAARRPAARRAAARRATTAARRAAARRAAARRAAARDPAPAPDAPLTVPAVSGEILEADGADGSAYGAALALTLPVTPAPAGVRKSDDQLVAELPAINATIRRGLSTFIVLGELFKIVYREEHWRVAGYASFPEWAAAEHGIGSTGAYDAIGSATAARVLETTPQGPPANESQALELSKILRRLGPEVLARAWRRLHESGEKITAAAIAAERRRLLDRGRARARRARRETAPAAGEGSETENGTSAGSADGSAASRLVLIVRDLDNDPAAVASALVAELGVEWAAEVVDALGTHLKAAADAANEAAAAAS